VLQEALAALRAEIGRGEDPPPQPPPPTAQPPRWSPRQRPEPPRRTLRGAIGGVLMTVFWVYGVAMPIMLGLALLVARANASLIGS
jgi:hypothetical protein